jgi:uncharacterized membrane protein YidH (DUF202 family)
MGGEVGADEPEIGALAGDEGLAPERTQLAWGRTGLALLVAIGVLARKVWSLSGPLEVTAIILVGIGGVIWMVGMRLSRDLHLTMEPHGLTGRRAFGLVTVGTIAFALGGLAFAIAADH